MKTFVFISMVAMLITSSLAFVKTGNPQYVTNLLLVLLIAEVSKVVEILKDKP